MRITAVETVWNESLSNFVWVRIETDEGLTGLGETFRNPQPVIAYVHETCAPYLLGQDPRAVARHAHALLNTVGNRFLGMPTRSVEICGNSAVDIALWDLKAQAADLSLTELLGGPVRDRIRIYNTCAGPGYNWSGSASARARVVQAGDPASTDPLDDLAAQAQRPGELAAELFDEGITTMKIWPFDAAALETGGAHISSDALAEGLGVLATIRDAVGERMDVMLEYHSLWSMAPARTILSAADEYRPFWHEDPVSMSGIADLAELRSRSRMPFAGSESHGTGVWFREALQARAVDYLHFDVGWVGGLSEAQRIAHLAAVHDRLIAPHDCTGPVVWIANLHLALSQPNTLILESVRAYWRGIYRELVTELPLVADGHAHAMTGPGLGTRLSDGLLAREDTVIRRTTLDDV